MKIRGMVSMKNKTACALLKNIPIVFLLAQVFFFLKRKSVFTHISLKGRDMMLGISLGI